MPSRASGNTRIGGRFYSIVNLGLQHTKIFTFSGVIMKCRTVGLAVFAALFSAGAAFALNVAVTGDLSSVDDDIGINYLGTYTAHGNDLSQNIVGCFQC